MSWVLIIAPLIAVILAYFGGKRAGKKEAELEQLKKEREQSGSTDEIIANNSNITDSDFTSWLQERSKK